MEVKAGQPAKKADLKEKGMGLIERWKYHFDQDYHFDLKTTILVFILIYLFGAVFGFVYEQSFYSLDAAIRGYTPNGTISGWSEWTILGLHFVKRGNQLGPWLPLYGYGALMMALILRPLRKKPWAVFLGAALVSGVIEYVTGWAMLELGGIRGWDYNVEIWNWGNINGFICFRSILFFAISGGTMVYIVEPVIRTMAAHIKEKMFELIVLIPFAVFMADYIINLLLGHGG